MIVVNRVDSMKTIARTIRVGGNSIGFIPTMGFLHEGHESLIAEARNNHDVVVVSIFVNPLQFGPNEDYDDYPRDFDRDMKICDRLGVDYIFYPEVEDMYPPEFSTRVVPSEKMTNILCGITRPTHFTGVCTVLSKLFSIITPEKVYMGKKDIQQLAIVKRMVSDLNIDTEIVGCPIVREEDGLAKSSRNVYLSDEERVDALCLSQALRLAVDVVNNGEKDSKVILDKMKSFIDGYKSARIDYIEILDFETFERVENIGDNTLIAMAVYIGETRLIDNILI